MTTGKVLAHKVSDLIEQVWPTGWPATVADFRLLYDTPDLGLDDHVVTDPDEVCLDIAQLHEDVARLFVVWTGDPEGLLQPGEHAEQPAITDNQPTTGNAQQGGTPMPDPFLDELDAEDAAVKTDAAAKLKAILKTAAAYIRAVETNKPAHERDAYLERLRKQGKRGEFWANKLAGNSRSREESEGGERGSRDGSSRSSTSKTSTTRSGGKTANKGAIRDRAEKEYGDRKDKYEAGELSEDQIDSEVEKVINSAFPTADGSVVMDALSEAKAVVL